jgi:hypothetical protein
MFKYNISSAYSMNTRKDFNNCHVKLVYFKSWYFYWYKRHSWIIPNNKDVFVRTTGFWNNPHQLCGNIVCRLRSKIFVLRIFIDWRWFQSENNHKVISKVPLFVMNIQRQSIKILRTNILDLKRHTIFPHSWWGLFQNPVVRTKLDIYFFSTASICNMFPA